MTPCPVCRAPYGFHDEAPHAAASLAVPDHLWLPSATTEREQRREQKQAEYRAWLAQQDAPC